MNHHDQVFMKRFAALIAGFAVFTVLLVLAAIWLNRFQTPAQSEVLAQQVELRIRPLSGVFAGETGREAMLAAQAAAAAAAVVRVAFDGSLDGALIYQRVCAACHDTGAGGSPLLVQSAWDARIAQGFEVMLQHSIEGFQGDYGIMPARGGRNDLSDEQVEAAIRHMLDNLR